MRLRAFGLQGLSLEISGYESLQGSGDEQTTMPTSSYPLRASPPKKKAVGGILYRAFNRNSYVSMQTVMT